jgi:hypothetical protein
MEFAPYNLTETNIDIINYKVSPKLQTRKEVELVNNITITYPPSKPS